jgi:hypothetical protein
MALPTAIGRYEIVARLATGGMAEILLGRIRGPESFERPVVIKRILGHLAALDSEKKMFLEEARIAAGIRHPNVVQVQELGSEDGELFLAMEYLEGESASSLSRRLTSRDETIARALAAHVAAEICAGLHAAHELVGADKRPLHVVHRDVSPQNIFITYAGDVKLLDFGIAKTVLSSAKTEAGTVKGKLAYMSPEQCQGHEVDRRSDVFALGIVLYELLTGKQLFQRSTPLKTMQAIATEHVVPASSIDPSIPTSLSDVCSKALSLHPNERFETALEMRRELLAVQRELAPTTDFREELGRLMQSLYADRIEAKERMLHQVRDGETPDNVPAGEADVDVDIPVHLEATVNERDLKQRTNGGTARDRVTAPPADRRRTVPMWPIALVLALGGLGIVATRRLASVPDSSSQPPAIVSAIPSAEAAPSVDPVAITLHLSSVPPGANVTVDGAPNGTTPATIRLPKSKTPVRVDLSLAGYMPLTQEIVPDVDQRIVLPLVAQRPRTRPTTTTPLPPAATTSAPAPPPPSAVPSQRPSGFTRFD